MAAYPDSNHFSLTRLNPEGRPSKAFDTPNPSQLRSDAYAPINSIDAENDAPTYSGKPGSIPMRSSSFYYVFKRFLVELMACLAAILSLVAIVAILATYDGRTLPNWPFGISINAVVSIFSVVFKGAMMIPVSECISQLKWSWFQKSRPLSDLARYDSASRGIWGSVGLIGRLHGTHLPTIGAAITILAVANDPFIQQVLKYHPCSQISTTAETASLARVNEYTQGGIHTGANLASLDLPMQAAIYEGVYNSFSTIQATCTTGNCTFNDFRTAGMCSQCVDITNKLNRTCPHPFSEENGCSGSCYWETPSGLNLTLPTDGKAMSTGPSSSDYDPQFPISTEIMWFRNIETVSGSNCSDVLNELELAAVNCSLWPCVRTYSANVTGGKTKEELRSTIPMNQSDFTCTAVPMPCLINGTYYDYSSLASLNSTSTMQTSGVDEQTGKTVNLTIPDECFFAMSSPLGLQEYLPGFLAGYVDDAPEDDYADPAWMGQLYDGGNATLSSINSTWTALADSMTVRMRQSPDGLNLTAVGGQAWHTDTCISVQWPWFAFPAALLALTIGFLVATIGQSLNDSSIQIWKSSPLALLFHGLDHHVREKVQSENQIEEMERTARGVFVKLGHEANTLRFIEAFQKHD